MSSDGLGFPFVNMIPDVFLILTEEASEAEWLKRLAFKLLAPLRWGSDPMRGNCQLLMEGCWFSPRNNLFLQLCLTSPHLFFYGR